MTRSKTAGLIIVMAAAAAVVALKTWQRQQQAGTPPQLPRACDTCITPPKNTGSKGEAPKVPTGSGLPCLVELGSTECAECKKMTGVLNQVRSELEGRVDVVVVDVEAYPEEADRWRLRVIPTQIALDAKGQEVWRHEGALTPQELISKLRELGLLPAERPRAAGKKPHPAAQRPSRPAPSTTAKTR